jgi:hypothetical protein
MQKTIQLIPVYNDWEYLKLHISEPDSLVKNISFQHEVLFPDDQPLLNVSVPILNRRIVDIWQKS